MTIGKILVSGCEDSSPATAMKTGEQIFVKEVEPSALDKGNGEFKPNALGKAILQMRKEGCARFVGIKRMLRH